MRHIVIPEPVQQSTEEHLREEITFLSKNLFGILKATQLLGSIGHQNLIGQVFDAVIWDALGVLRQDLVHWMHQRVLEDEVRQKTEAQIQVDHVVALKQSGLAKLTVYERRALRLPDTI